MNGNGDKRVFTAKRSNVAFLNSSIHVNKLPYTKFLDKKCTERSENPIGQVNNSGRRELLDDLSTILGRENEHRRNRNKFRISKYDVIEFRKFSKFCKEFNENAPYLDNKLRLTECNCKRVIDEIKYEKDKLDKFEFNCYRDQMGFEPVSDTSPLEFSKDCTSIVSNSSEEK